MHHWSSLPRALAKLPCTQIWQLPKCRAYTAEQWEALPGGGHAVTTANGEVDCRRLNMKERLAVCASTEMNRLVFGKVGAAEKMFKGPIMGRPHLVAYQQQLRRGACTTFELKLAQPCTINCRLPSFVHADVLITTKQMLLMPIDFF